eukprot:53879_1
MHAQTKPAIESHNELSQDTPHLFNINLCIWYQRTPQYKIKNKLNSIDQTRHSRQNQDKNRQKQNELNLGVSSPIKANSNSIICILRKHHPNVYKYKMEKRINASQIDRIKTTNTAHRIQ